MQITALLSAIQSEIYLHPSSTALNWRLFLGFFFLRNVQSRFAEKFESYTSDGEEIILRYVLRVTTFVHVETNSVQRGIRDS